VITDDGTIYGTADNVGKVRTPAGKESTFTCGNYPESANSAGEVLAGNGANEQILHDGRCYLVSSLMPNGDEGWTFPQGQVDQLNDKGQMLLEGIPPSGGSSETVLLTPRYPLAASMSVTATKVPGEYDFSTTVTDGTGEPTTTTWDFGDGGKATTSGSGTVAHRFTKPGAHTVSGRVVDSAHGLTTTVTKTVVVPAPSLSISISTPGHKADKLPAKATVKIDVVVKASKGGVGHLSDLTFHGGEFTSSKKKVLMYTTSATPPFTLSPGDAKTFTTKVKTAKTGRTTLSSVITGSDAIERKVSGSDTEKVRIKKR
jgi:hypothetical protein